MNSNGRAGHGRGNNRRRPGRRRENDGDTQKAVPSGGGGQAGKQPEAGSLPERRSQGHRPVSENQGGRNRNNHPRRNTETFRLEREKNHFFERPKWVPPKLNTEPLAASDCPWCGKPIRDISSAIADKDSGVPVHFDCVISRIAFGEKLEKGEAVTYIGGGRFGVVSFGASHPNTKESHDKTSSRNFTIKKIIEWEDKDKRADWRSVICDHYSVT